MPYCRALFISLLCVLVVGCKDEVNESKIILGSPEAAQSEAVRPFKKDSGSEAKVISLGIENVKPTKERFPPETAEAISGITGRSVKHGLTTRDALGNPLKTKFADGSAILYSSGRMHQFIDGDGKTTSYNSDEKNLPVSSIDADGVIEQFIYDADGKLISKRNKDGQMIPIQKSK